MSSKKSASVKRDGKPPLTPNLRFPEFRNASGWNEQEAGALFSNRNDEGVEGLPIYSVTMNDGMVKRSSFDRDFYDIAEPSGNKKACKGDIAYNMMRMWQGAFGIAPEDCMVSPAYVVLAPGEGVRSDFFGYLFKLPQYLRLLTSHSQGLTKDRLRLYYKDFAQIPLRYPCPQEQAKIAAALASVDALIVAHGRKVEALKVHKKGLMQQLFPQEGESQPRLRFPEFEGAGEWQEAKLEAACNMQAGKFVAASEIQVHSAEGLFPCYGGNGLRGYIASFTHLGRYPLIGRQGALCGNVKFAVGKFHATEHAVVASPKKGLSVDWLFYLLDHLDLNQFATGQAQPGLSVDVLNNVMTSIPNDEAEQQRIADCLTSLDDLIAAETQTLDTLKTNKKGLMQQLFPQVGEGDA